MASQPFGLKGDVLGETIDDFRTRNERIITLGSMGLNRAKFAPDLPRTKNLPQCSNSESASNGKLSWDVRDLTDEEKRAGVVKCIAALSLDDDVDFDDSPTVANVPAFRIVYYFFHLRLYMIKSTLPGSKYPILRNAFIEKYGTPLISTAQYQNSFGAKFEGERLLWKNDSSQILVGQRDGEPDDPSVLQLKDLDDQIRSTTIRTEAIGKGYEAERDASVYDKVLRTIRDQNKRALESSNVLITIWHNSLRKECETTEGVKDRQKNM